MHTGLSNALLCEGAAGLAGELSPFEPARLLRSVQLQTKEASLENMPLCPVSRACRAGQSRVCAPWLLEVQLAGSLGCGSASGSPCCMRPTGLLCPGPVLSGKDLLVLPDLQRHFARSASCVALAFGLRVEGLSVAVS